MNLGPNFRKLPFLVLAALVIAGLGALVGRYMVLREVPTKKETFKALSWLQDDFGSLYRVLTPGARALVEDPDDKNQILEDPDAPLTRADLRRKTAAIRQEALSWIRKGLRTRYESAVAPANQRLVRYVFSAPGEPVDWASGVGEVCRSLTLENLGPVVAENVVIVLDGERLAATLGEMTASLLGSAATEKDKALALWRGVVEGRCHDWPAHAEASDPIKLLGVYGYGFCLDSAQALALLAESAGLSARVMHARGTHVVTEILIDGRWALFDADAAVFYRKPDGNLASIADVQQDLELLADSESNIYSKEHLRRIYASADFAERDKRKLQASHSLRVNLRPGESILYSRERKGIFFATRYLEEPREYANGLWRFRPRFSGEAWRAGVAAAENLVAV